MCLDNNSHNVDHRVSGGGARCSLTLASSPHALVVGLVNHLQDSGHTAHLQLCWFHPICVFHAFQFNPISLKRISQSCVHRHTDTVTLTDGTTWCVSTWAAWPLCV